jgi:hypothetical protein
VPGGKLHYAPLLRLGLKIARSLSEGINSKLDFLQLRSTAGLAIFKLRSYRNFERPFPCGLESGEE